MIPSVKFSTTNENVSSLCLGCLNFGTKTSEELSYKLLNQYCESGGSFIDTANNYAFWEKGAKGGESEESIGRWMKDRQNRKSIFLATKIGALPKTPGAGFEDAEGLSSKAIYSAVEKSLAKLNTDYIDLLYAHIDDTKVPLDKTLNAFDKLIQSGKVRHIGCSNYTAERLLESLNVSIEKGYKKYSCIQSRFSYLTPMKNADFGVQVATNKELQDLCKKEKISLLAYSPLLGGFYNRGTNLQSQYGNTEDQSVQKKLKALQKVASSIELDGGNRTATPAQIVFAWMTAASHSVIPLVAASSESQLKENLDSANIVLSSEQIEYLDRMRLSEIS